MMAESALCLVNGGAPVKSVYDIIADGRRVITDDAEALA